MDRNNYYINGNTVRRVGTEPVRREQKSRQQQQADRRKRSRRNAARRNRQRALYMNRGYVAFLSICVVISAVAAFLLVRIQMDIKDRMNNIATLESQITDLKADNDERYKRITTSVDLNRIKDIAVNELGMDYAGQDQVIYYTVEKTNYMDQYSDIPEGK